MKELSIEQKAKRYDEAVKYGQNLINERCKEGTDGSFHRADLQKMFPELKESEDEKMMNQLHSWMKEFGGAEEYTEKVYQWIKGLLEKQGEQKPAETRKFKVGDVVKYNGTEYKITAVESNGYRVYALTYDEDAASLISFSAPAILVEQKPAWSEEDENMLENTIGLIEVLDRETKGAFITKEYIDFLKSLKERYTWRPSDNELEVLRLAAEKDGACLMGLYEQLKKLKE